MGRWGKSAGAKKDKNGKGIRKGSPPRPYSFCENFGFHFYHQLSAPPVLTFNQFAPLAVLAFYHFTYLPVSALFRFIIFGHLRKFLALPGFTFLPFLRPYMFRHFYHLPIPPLSLVDLPFGR